MCLNAHGGTGRMDAESETFVPVARSVAIRGRDGVSQVELGDDKANAILTPSGGRAGIGVGAVLAPALTSNPYGDHESREGLLVSHTLRGEGHDASEDGTGRGVPIVPMAFMDTESHSSGSNIDISPTMRTGDCAKICVAEVADTLTAYWERSKGAKAGNQVGVLNPIIYPSAVRRLMPVECERLQGFPDDYTAITYRGKPAADGPRYKALGNSMAVPVVRWIGERIAMVDGISDAVEAAE